MGRGGVKVVVMSSKVVSALDGVCYAGEGRSTSHVKGLALSLLEALKDTPVRKSKTRMAEILLVITPAEQEVLEAALSGDVWTHQALADVLTQQGHPVSEASVRRHRRRSN